MKKIGWIVISILVMIGLSGCFGKETHSEFDDAQQGAVEQSGEDENGTDAGNDNQESSPEPTDESDPLPDSDEPGEPSEADGGDSEIPAKHRPKTKSDVISLEGMEEPFEFTLYDVPSLQFSTYLADDLVAESGSSGEGDTFTVYANFAGQRNEDAKVIYFAPDSSVHTSVNEQAKAAEQTLVDEGYDLLSGKNITKRFDFSERELYFSKQKENGHLLLVTVSVFERNNRVYRIMVQYPEDFEEGFMPRVAKMFEDIMWYAE